MTVLEFTDDQRREICAGSTSDSDERQRRFRRFDDAAFAFMKRAILLGDITDTVMARVERDCVAALRAMPETLAEMLLYTGEINIGITGQNYCAGWPWARYTCRKYLHLDCTFSPYRGDISAWTDSTAPDGVVRFQ